MAARGLLGLLVILPVIISLCYISALPLQASMPPAVENTILSDYTEHSPIAILSDEDFETQAWPGNGSPESPFVISNLIINSSVEDVPCIDIRHTRKNFIVNACYLYRVKNNNFYSVGLFLSNTTNGVIQEITCVNNRAGIYLRNSNNTMITGNNCSNNDETGILVWDSDNTFIIENECNSNRQGIWVATNLGPKNNNLTFLRNACDSNYAAGAILDDCWGLVVINNTGIWNGDSLVILNSRNGRITNNTLLECESRGLVIDGGSRNFTITNNTVYSRWNGINVVGYEISVKWNAFTSTEFHSAVDELGNNEFEYNFYSDYEGDDEDNDGIGDTPYIDLYGNVWDEHPLMYYPWFPPIPTSTTSTTPTDTTTTSTSTTTSTTIPASTTTPTLPDNSQFQLMMMYGLGLSTGIITLVIVILFLRRRGG